MVRQQHVYAVYHCVSDELELIEDGSVSGLFLTPVRKKVSTGICEWNDKFCGYCQRFPIVVYLHFPCHPNFFGNVAVFEHQHFVGVQILISISC